MIELIKRRAAGDRNIDGQEKEGGGVSKVDNSVMNRDGEVAEGRVVGPR